MDKSYNILWIDDEVEKLKSFITDAEQDNIIINPFSTSKEGMKAFEESIYDWDAVILDAKCWDESADETADTTGMHNSLEKITELKYKRVVPVFIFSGQADLQDDEEFKKSLRGKRVYKKGNLSDTKQLFADIKTEADKLIETQIRHKYNDLFSWIPLSEELLKILMYIESDSIYDVACFNEVRKMLEWVRNRSIERGLLPKEITELNGFSKYLCDNKMREYVPIYIQRSLHSCIVVSQEGSHLLTIDKAMKNGETPYLLRSTVFELLNVLYWCKSLPNDIESIEAIRSKVASLTVSTQDEDVIDVVEGVIEQDEKRNYHCGEYLLNYSEMSQDDIGKSISINKSIVNTQERTKDTYKYFVFRSNFDITE